MVLRFLRNYHGNLQILFILQIFTLQI